MGDPVSGGSRGRALSTGGRVELGSNQVSQGRIVVRLRGRPWGFALEISFEQNTDNVEGIVLDSFVSFHS